MSTAGASTFNTGAADASGLTLTDTLNSLVAVAPQTDTVVDSSLGWLPDRLRPGMADPIDPVDGESREHDAQSAQRDPDDSEWVAL